MNYDWKKLDQELIDLYTNDTSAVNKFVNKYGMSMQLVYYRLKKLGIKLKFGKGIVKLKMEKSSNWKGGKYINTDGYVMVYVGNEKYQYEHILVMEKHLGRKLKRNEIPHHVDESFKGKSNNDLSNLELMTKSDHVKHHLKSKKNRGEVRDVEL